MTHKHYEIPRRHRRCVMGDEEFTHGMSYYSLIEPIQEGGYDRKDYCKECWKTVFTDPATRPDGKIYWRSTVPQKFEASEDSLRRDEKALRLLKEVYHGNSPEELEQAFVLALLLSRNKLLQLKQEVKEEGKSFQLYEVRSTEEMLLVLLNDLWQEVLENQAFYTILRKYIADNT